MSDATTAAQDWFLRISDDTIFGPVNLKGLIIWAEQGQIAPGNEVSTDRKKWRPAEEVAELQMSWYIEKPSGQLVGPFHRLAAEVLVREAQDGGARLVAAADPGRLLRDRRAAKSVVQHLSQRDAAARADQLSGAGGNPRRA